MGLEWAALDALSHQLELCKIDAATRVVVLLDRSIAPDRVELIRAAVARTGAEALEVGPTQGDANALDRLSGQHLLPTLLDEADVVIACMQPDPAGTGALHVALRESPAHVLRLRPQGNPQDYPPHINMRRRVDALDTTLRSGLVLHLSDHHGTDLHVQLHAGAVHADHGLIGDQVDDAAFPSGWAEATPAAATVHGDLVLMPGDVNVSAGRSISSPLRLQIVDDHISAIKGENADADMLRAQFEYPGDPHAYGMAGISIGMNPGTSPLVTFDERLVQPDLCRLLAGVVTISFGDNLVADRPCAQMTTLALPGRTIRIDDLPVLTAGALDGDFAPDVYEL